MSIHFVLGKPGGGKTLYAMKLILEELRQGDRLVVTNVALNLSRFNEYIQEKYPGETINLWQRVSVLTEDMCREFWKYRTMPGIEDKGAFIVLDELHLFFNAREWMNTGKDCLHYLSQHRKLGDDVICVTQHVGNVDKQFRSVAQDFTLVVNGFKQKLGLFRGLPCFNRYTYSSEPNGTRVEPDDTGHFRLDAKGIASCYNTAAGVGVHGRGADKAEKRRGLPLWVFPVVALVFIAVVIFGMKGCNKALRSRAEKKQQERQASVAHPPAASQGDAKRAGGVAPATQKAPDPTPASQQPTPVESVGRVADRPKVAQKLIRKDGRARIVMTDGTVYESSDGDLEQIQNHRVKIKGEWYGYRQAGPGVSRPVIREEEVKVVEYPKREEPESAWVTDADGVSKLRHPVTSIGQLMGR